MAVSKRTKLAVLARDNYVCVIAGLNCVGVATVVDHRANRGSGGSTVLDAPENLIACCPLCNGGKEDADGAYRAELVARGIRNATTAVEHMTTIGAITTGKGWAY